MRTFIALLVTAATFAAFGQGKTRFENDSLHLVYYTPDTTLLRAADAPLAGQGVSSVLMPLSVQLVADLYVGTSSSSLSLISSTVFGTQAGRISGANVLLPLGMPGGSQLWFQVQVRDSAYASETLSLASGSYGGHSVIFTSIPGSAIAYNSIVNPNPPTSSTWPPGDFDMSTQTGLPGARGAIRVSLIPEPGVVVLALLGVCAWRPRRNRGRR